MSIVSSFSLVISTYLLEDWMITSWLLLGCSLIVALRTVTCVIMTLNELLNGHIREE